MLAAGTTVHEDQPTALQATAQDEQRSNNMQSTVHADAQTQKQHYSFCSSFDRVQGVEQSLLLTGSFCNTKLLRDASLLALAPIATSQHAGRNILQGIGYSRARSIHPLACIVALGTSNTNRQSAPPTAAAKQCQGQGHSSLCRLLEATTPLFTGAKSRQSQAGRQQRKHQPSR